LSTLSVNDTNTWRGDSEVTKQTESVP
jgi:hypothetical protein